MPNDKLGEFNKLILDELYPDPVRSLGMNAPRLSDLAANCLYVLDANILLVPFELGEKGAANVASIYRTLFSNNRLFVPKRAVQEFANRRTSLLGKAYEGLMKYKSDSPTSLSPKLPFLEAVGEYARLRDAAIAAADARKAYQKALDELMHRLTDWSWNDEISGLYAEVFNSETIIDHEMNTEDITADLAWRVRHKIPPGFEDSSKPDGGIGDVLIWHSLIALGKRCEKNVVLVSNDGKPDWAVSAKTSQKDQPDIVVHCRPELAQEFHAKTNQFFGLATFARFLDLNGALTDTVRKAVEIEHADGVNPIRRRLMEISAALNTMLSHHLRYAEQPERQKEWACVRDPSLKQMIDEYASAFEAYQMAFPAQYDCDHLRYILNVLREIEVRNDALLHLDSALKYLPPDMCADLTLACRSFVHEHQVWSRTSP